MNHIFRRSIPITARLPSLGIRSLATATASAHPPVQLYGLDGMYCKR